MSHKNPIWQFFEKCSTDQSKAVCKICNKLYSLGSNEPKKQTLHGLKQHLSKFHEPENKQMLKRLADINDIKSEAKSRRISSCSTISIASSSSTAGSIQTTIPKMAAKNLQWPDDHDITKRIDKGIMDLLIVDMLPYSLVAGEAFQRLNFSDPQGVRKYRLKSEKFFRTSLMPQTYEKVKSKVKTLMAKSEWVSATTDIWSNESKSCSLLSFTAHFIVDHQRLKVILGACVLEENHTGQYIEQKFTEMVNEWNLKNKIFMVLRDNAPNMASAMRSHYESIGCVAHTLQLVIKQALFLDEQTKTLLKKCRKIVGHFHHSEKATRKLTECQQQCGLPQHALVQDIEIRWNSTYLMLLRILEQKSAVNLYSIEHGKIETLVTSEWELVRNLTDVLKFFYEATLDLSFDHSCVSIAIPLISLLNRKLQERADDENDEVISTMKASLHDGLNNKFSFLRGNPSLIASTLLDPRFKSKYLSSDEVDIGVREIITFLVTLENPASFTSGVDHVRAISPEPIPSISNTQQQKESLWDPHDSTSNLTNEMEAVEDRSFFFKQKLETYLTEPLMQRNANIFEYWHSSPYPSLRKAAIKYLSAPPTSVPSEQLFSAAGQIYADRRSNLHGENVEKLLFLAYNIRLFNYDY